MTKCYLCKEDKEIWIRESIKDIIKQPKQEGR